MLLSEMFGVERDTPFMVDGYTAPFMVRLVDNFERLFVLRFGEYVQAVNINFLQDLINRAPAGIIRLPPPLTDEQREQLKAIWTLGGRWLAKDCDGSVNYYLKMPCKENGYWYISDCDEKCGYDIPLSASVCGLQELNRVDEPYDIAKALGIKN